MHNRTNKSNKSNKSKTKTNKTRKQSRGRGLFLKTTTPEEINKISQQINTDLNSINSINKDSYSPSINNQLVTLKSISRQPLIDCNTNKAFSLKQPLEINIDNKCYPYSSNTAKKFLLKNLSANKHINPKNIITPIQALGNCWFNTMFVTLFVSDKGRKFFHFFRELMIEGKTSDNDKPIPKNLKNGLALLNYAIDACLTGNKFAYKMDTNTIIKDIYNNIPPKYKDVLPYITNIKEAGNPIRYYGSLIYYLHDKSIQMAFISSCNNTWKIQLLNKLKEYETQNPHLIILEFFDEESKVVTNKATKFALPNGAQYKLDSCIIRNTKGHHFSSLLTCEKKEYGYDGMSFHRLVPLSWKKNLNKDFVWKFEGSTDNDDELLEWNFRSGYQMLVYYRIQ